MSDTFFPDTSNFQSSIDFEALRTYTPVNIEQLSWGTLTTILPGRVAAIRAANFVLTIWYLGLVANQDIAAQVATFTAQLPTLGPTDAVFIDWEDTPNTINRTLVRQPNEAQKRRRIRFNDGATPTSTQRNQAAQLLAQHYGCDIKFIGVYGSPGNIAAAPPAGWTILASYETSEPSYPHTVWQFCVDEQTEALTWDGWKDCSSIRVGDVLLTLNPHTGLSEWCPAEKVSRFQNDQPLISMESELHSSLSTTNHRWLVRRYMGGPLTFVQTDALCKNDRIPCSAPCTDIPTVPKWSDALVELVSWYWTEGWPTGSDCGVYIAQSHVIHPEECNQIRSCLRQLFGEPVDRNRPDYPTWSESRWEETTKFRLSKAASKWLHMVAPDRVVTTDFVHSLTKAQLLLFLEVSVKADGWTNKGGSRFITQSKPERLVAIEMACALLGIATHGIDNELPYVGKTGQHSHTHCLTLRKRSGTVPARAGIVTMKDHHGTVWCPTTKNGTWLARRKGSVYFTGNTDGVYISNPYHPINFPGIGFCDANVFHGSVDQLAAIVRPNAAPLPPTPEADMAGISPPLVIAGDPQTHQYLLVPPGHDVPAGATFVQEHRASIFMNGAAHWWWDLSDNKWKVENVAVAAANAANLPPDAPLRSMQFDPDQVPDLSFVRGQIAYTAIKVDSVSPQTFRQTPGLPGWGAVGLI